MLARAAGAETQTPLYMITATDLMNHWFGASERLVRLLFDTVKKHPRAILFIDELEALAPSRSGTDSIDAHRILAEQPTARTTCNTFGHATT